jgi:predicted transcriptional regulator
MRRGEAKESLSRAETDLAALLAGAGLDPKAAKVAVFLLRFGMCRSQAIERGCGMHPRDVAEAAKRLEARGWLSRERTKIGGEGRPVLHLRMTAPLATIARELATLQDALERAEESEWARIRTVLAGAPSTWLRAPSYAPSPAAVFAERIPERRPAPVEAVPTMGVTMPGLAGAGSGAPRFASHDAPREG